MGGHVVGTQIEADLIAAGARRAARARQAGEQGQAGAAR